MAPLLLTVFSLAACADEISVSDLSPKQGQVIEVKVSGLAAPQDAAALPDLKFKENSCKLFSCTESGDSCYRTLVGIPADIAPGKYKLVLGSDEKTITVRDAKFPFQNIHLTKDKDNFDMSPGEEEALKAAKSSLSPERLWSGPFARPSTARISAVFGAGRAVNGRRLKDYFHSGLDFAGFLGTPIVSTAKGKVVMARRGFKLHGNCVAVDHGQGVISIYIHMQNVLVKEGQMVERGEKLGTVGRTGRANGPHLHFSLYVNQVATNPMPWFTTVF